MIPGSASAQFFGAAGSAGGGAGGYEIERSLRFNSADSAYLSRTPASAGNRKTWTWAGWVKRARLGSSRVITNSYTGDTDSSYGSIQFLNSDALRFGAYNTVWRDTTAVLRDPSAWYHIVVALDTTQAVANDRVKMYVNGTVIIGFTTLDNPSLNADLAFNQAGAHNIGNSFLSAAHFDGYLADVHFIDGQALDPSSFGEFDTNGVWQPIDASGLTYGTNGFYLPFSDNSTAAALGTDTSGNGNDWTPNNLTVAGSSNYADYISRFTSGESKYNAFDGSLSTYVSQDISDTTGITFTPSPTITVTSLLRFYHTTGIPSTKEYIINGGSAVTTPNSGWVSTSFTGTLSSFVLRDNRGVGYAAGLYAIEVDGTILVDYRSVSGNDSLVDSPTNYGTDTGAGGEVRGNYATLNPLANGGLTLSNGNLDISRATASWKNARGTIAYPASGKWYWEFTCLSNTDSTNGPKVGIVTAQASLDDPGGDAFGWAYLGYNGTKWNNGISSAYGATWTNGDVIGTVFDADAGTLVFYKNGVSQGTAFSGLTTGPYFPVAGIYGTGSGSLNFGQRPFAYTAPSGFKALCTTNLPEPTIADGSTAMDVVLYTGNGSTQSISGLEFSPDFVWIKIRSDVRNHALYDAVRGAGKVLFSNNTEIEITANDLTSFDANGFSVSTVGGTRDETNMLNATYVAWTWDAGSSTVTNNDGSISSQVRANASAGFSVQTWTASGTGSDSWGHGLGIAPEFVIVKRRSSAQDWYVWHKSITSSQYLLLNSTASVASYTNIWGASGPSSSLVYYSASPGDHVSYAFAPVAGYSSFGSYTGNGSADGPFVFTGMRPRWVMVKRTDTTGGWIIIDTARSTYNVVDTYLYANEAWQENYYGAVVCLDALSNGFKLRSSTTAELNASGGTYIYAAFAEHPFKTSRAR